jgi:hypothetical protein
MNPLVRACRRALPYLGTAFVVVELDRVVDVQDLMVPCLVPLLICCIVLAADRLSSLIRQRK